MKTGERVCVSVATNQCRYLCPRVCVDESGNVQGGRGRGGCMSQEDTLIERERKQEKEEGNDLRNQAPYVGL